MAVMPAVEARRVGRPDKRQVPGKEQAGCRVCADRLEGASIHQIEPARPAGTALPALPAFPTALAGEFGQDEGSTGRTAGWFGLVR
jgi:hypothetical protein